MDSLSLEELQQVEADLLAEFADFCEANGLRYYLYAGTLLGAVRHKGFIPWDDDTDVMMPRPDYDRLMAITRAAGAHGCLMQPGDDGYYFHFAKWVDSRTRFVEPGVNNPDGYGIFIDIFPLDAVTLEGGVAQKQEVDKVTRGLYYAYRADPCQFKGAKGIAKRIVGAIARRGRSEAELFAKLRECSVKHEFGATGYVAVLCANSFDKEVLPLGELDSDKTEVFCGRAYRVVKNPEQELRSLYGDTWRTPIKREAAQHGAAYWRMDVSDIAAGVVGNC